MNSTTEATTANREAVVSEGSVLAGTETPLGQEARSAFIPAWVPGDRGAPEQAREPATAESPPSVVISPETVQWDPRRIDPAVIAFHDRYSSICEQYRSVRARLLTMNTTHAHQVIAITSSVPQEGKTVSVVNLALVMAEGGEHSILIADADLRWTSIARMLGIEQRPGLTELLRGELELSEVLRPTPLPNLKIIPAGTIGDKGHAELLRTPTTRAVLDRIRASFDYAFLDTSPVTTVADVSMLAPHCDGAILVIEMRRTPEPMVQQAVRTLQANNVEVLGCILSRYRDRHA